MAMISTAAREQAGARRAPKIMLSSSGRGWRGIEAEFIRIPAGATYVAPSTWHRLGIHFGRSVNADCQCDGRRHRRVQAHGDIDIVPMGLDGVWEDDADCTILRLTVAPERPSSVKIVVHPACCKAARCSAVFWSSVDTRA